MGRLSIKLKDWMAACKLLGKVQRELLGKVGICTGFL